ncbi:hypothetical protein WDV93_00170 [Pantoea ananatis]
MKDSRFTTRSKAAVKAAEAGLLADLSSEGRRRCTAMAGEGGDLTD